MISGWQICAARCGTRGGRRRWIWARGRRARTRPRVRLAPSYTGEERDRIIRGLRAHDIGAGDYFPCIHLQPFYQQRHGFRPGMFPIAESVSQRTIALPFFNDLTARQVDAVASTLEL